MENQRQKQKQNYSSAHHLVFLKETKGKIIHDLNRSKDKNYIVFLHHANKKRVEHNYKVFQIELPSQISLPCDIILQSKKRIKYSQTKIEFVASRIVLQ